MEGLLLGIDVGAYSSKGVIVQPDRIVPRTQVVDHSMDIPHLDWAEQDADTIWWNDVVQICRHFLNGSPYHGEDVAGVHSEKRFISAMSGRI